MKIVIGTQVDLVDFGYNQIWVGQEATLSIGDSYPAKVLSITRVNGGWLVDLQCYGLKRLTIIGMGV